MFFIFSTPTSSIRYEEVDPLTARANRMIDMLTEENRKLRDELRVYNRKVSRLQKFEFEIQKVHEAYESLVKSSQKREKLESIMKKKLKEELRKLQATNKQLQGEPFLFFTRWNLVSHVYTTYNLIELPCQTSKLFQM